MQVNQWGDPVNTVYAVMGEDRFLLQIFKCWREACEYADRLNIDALRRGEPEQFYALGQPLLESMNAIM